MSPKALKSKRPRPTTSRRRPAEAIGLDVLLFMYRKLLEVYYVESRLETLAASNKVLPFVSSWGRAKLQIAMARSLNVREDWILPAAGDTALALAAGMTPHEIFLHMLSRRGAASSGLSPAGYLSSRSLRIVSRSGREGTQAFTAVGLARALRRASKAEVVCVSHDGRDGEEVLAALRLCVREGLPVVFLVQRQEMKSPDSDGASLARMASAVGAAACRVDGTRFTQTLLTTQALVRSARKSKVPVLVDGIIQRLAPRSSRETAVSSKTKEAREALRSTDPLANTEAELLSRGILTLAEAAESRERIAAAVDDALRTVDATPPPEARAILQRAGLRPEGAAREPEFVSEGEVTMAEALARGLSEELRADPAVVLLAATRRVDGNAPPSVAKELAVSFPGRVAEDPLTAGGILGIAQGMAIAGLRPVVELGDPGDAMSCLSYLRNEIPTLRWRSGGEWACPMVVRLASGGARRGLVYGHNIESLVTSLPGWTVVCPSNAADAKGLIKAACRSEDPVLFLESSDLIEHAAAGTPEPDEDYVADIGRARLVRRGEDVSIVTWGPMVHRCRTAADLLARDGIKAEIIDLRTLIPYEGHVILSSVEKTGRSLIVHEESDEGGLGAEIASFIVANAFESLDAPVRRVGAKSRFLPATPSLASQALPGADDVLDAVREIVSY